LAVGLDNPPVTPLCFLGFLQRLKAVGYGFPEEPVRFTKGAKICCSDGAYIACCSGERGADETQSRRFYADDKFNPAATSGEIRTLLLQFFRTLLDESLVKVGGLLRGYK
jgi:hypothetical protein